MTTIKLVKDSYIIRGINYPQAIKILDEVSKKPFARVKDFESGEWRRPQIRGKRASFYENKNTGERITVYSFRKQQTGFSPQEYARLRKAPAKSVMARVLYKYKMPDGRVVEASTMWAFYEGQEDFSRFLFDRYEAEEGSPRPAKGTIHGLVWRYAKQ